MYKRLKILINNKFVFDSAANIISAGATALVGFIISSILITKFKANGLGLYSQLFSILAFISVISTFGVNTAVLKYSAQYKEEEKTLCTILTSALLIVIAFSSLILVLFVVLKNVFLLHYNSDFLNHFMIILTGTIPLSINKVFLGFFNGLRKMTAYAVFQSTRAFILVILTAFFSLYVKSFNYALMSIPMSESIMTLIMFAYSLKYLKLSFSNFHTWNKKHLDFGFKILLSNVLTELNNRTDILIASLFLDVKLVGIYSYSASIAKGFLLIPSAIQSNFNPVISSLFSKNNTDTLRKYIKQVKQVSTKISLVIFLLGMLGFPIIAWVFLPKDLFYINYVLFIISLFGVVLITPYYLFGGTPSMSGHPEDSLKIGVCLTASGVFLQVVFVNLIGVYGIALATTVNYVALIFYLKYFINKKIKNLI